jgi:hypothetical protein
MAATVWTRADCHALAKFAMQAGLADVEEGKRALLLGARLLAPRIDRMRELKQQGVDLGTIENTSRLASARDV